MPVRTWWYQQFHIFRSTSNRDKAKHVARGFFKVLNVMCAFHLFSEYVGRITDMEGPSMLPTLADHGEWVIEDRLSLRLFPDSLHRGDLIVLQSPVQPGRIICKRIIGLPGDIVCVDPTGQHAPPSEHLVVPKYHVWISGDNAAFSRDSREYGPVSMSLIQGKLWARVRTALNAKRFYNNLGAIV